MTLRYDGATRAGAAATSTSTSRAGTTVALVGATGSGKTTLVPLVPRLYDVDRGRGARRRRRRARRRPARAAPQIAVVADDPFLFSRDRAREHRLRAPRREPRGGRGGRAPRAGARASSSALPDGYDTRVGERGLTLSGGQRQRLAIARALLADPRILILDDATSTVDASTEQQIKGALREVMAGRTTFVIAHRLSTISLADEIVVLEDGRLVARGTHDELLERLRRSTARSSRRACPTRSSSPASRSSRRWRACDPARPLGPARGRPPAGRAEDAGFRERLHLLWDDSRRRLRGTGGRGRKVRGLAALLRPVPRARRSACSSRSSLGAAASLAPAPLAAPRSTRASSPATSRR